MLKGQELVAKVAEIREGEAGAAQVTPVSEVVLACGYVRENGKPDFTGFYTELMVAKGYDNPAEEVEMDEHEAELRERFGDGAVDAFIEYWSVEDLKYFEDAYASAERPEEFARELVEDCYGTEVPSFVVIDWAATWDNLRYDFIELDGYIFSTNW